MQEIYLVKVAFGRSIHQAHKTNNHMRLADQATALMDGGGGPKIFMK